MPLLNKRLITGLIALTATLTVACSGTDDEVPTPEPTPAQVSARGDMPKPEKTPVVTPTVEPTPDPTPRPTPTPRAYDSNRVLYEVFPGFSLTSSRVDQALEEIRINQDMSMVPVLVEILRYQPSVNSRERVAKTLRAVTGQTFSGDEWTEWMEWAGENLQDVEPPSNYADWKAALYTDLDSRFALFLRPAREFSRINLTEVVWGGVLPDGIPDLRNPKFLEPAEADYLNPDDRVFGVQINGESKAYPLRIVNAHEMVNDWVGGEPISLMW